MFFFELLKEMIPESLSLSEPQGVAVDSRLLCHNDLFFALPGEHSDGHYYLQEVHRKGAVGAVVCKDYSGIAPTGLPLLRVDDPLQVLQRLTKALVDKVSAKTIALTGSVGKTTTKEFICTILSMNHKVTATQGNYNSQVGMCVSLLNGIQGDESWIVAEMGMTAAGHIYKLIDIMPPDIAMVTRVALVHAGNFYSLEEIAKAKAEIFLSPRTSQVIYNADSPCSEILLESVECDVRRFSFYGHPEAFWQLSIEENHMIVREDGKSYSLPLPLFVAPHVYENLLAAIACCRSAGVSYQEIEASIPYLQLPEKRLEQYEHQGIRFINDTYNASEISMVAALDVLGSCKDRRRVAVLGQMHELGEFSESCHRRVGEKALEVADSLYCLGPECAPIVDLWRSSGRVCCWASSIDELSSCLKKELQEGDTVLVKGSNANKLWTVVEQFS